MSLATIWMDLETGIFEVSQTEKDKTTCDIKEPFLTTLSTLLCGRQSGSFPSQSILAQWAHEQSGRGVRDGGYV